MRECPIVHIFTDRRKSQDTDGGNTAQSNTWDTFSKKLYLDQVVEE